jgi:hypothetical protein
MNKVKTSPYPTRESLNGRCNQNPFPKLLSMQFFRYNISDLRVFLSYF